MVSISRMRIDAAVYMDNIWILKAADNMYDSVYLTDIGKELVSKTFALGSALYQTGDIHELDDSRSDFGRIVQICQLYPDAASGTGTTPTFGSMVQNG